MNNKDMMQYGRAGLRSAQEWANRGREVDATSTPRASATWDGKEVNLFSRDQTTIKPGRLKTKAAATGA